MDETLMPNPIKKRLAMQNEVLKWLMEFSEKVEKRASDATVEVNGLLDQAGLVELDLRNAFNSFHGLSYNRSIDHRIEDDGYYTKDSGKSSTEAGIPVQNYETDILPRYREALSVGLTSCKNHLHNTKKGQSSSSLSKTGSFHDQLPHIIGSEEYMHDNSCGIIEEFASGTLPLDFSYLLEPTGVPSDSKEHDSPDLFGSDMFGVRPGSSGKDTTEPQVSAALDFKAMLEAALRNPYKFYDEETLSRPDVNDNSILEQIQTDVDLVASTSFQAAASINRSIHLDVAEESIPVTEGDLASLHDPQVYSALVSGSLFDTEEEPSTQELPCYNPAEVADGSEGAWENADAIEDVKFENLTLPDEVKDDGSALDTDSSHEIVDTKELHGSDELVDKSAEGRPSDAP